MGYRADVASNVDGFYVYRAVYDPTSISSISAKPRFVLIAELRPDARKYKDEKIKPGYIYYYKVCAFNECGETCSEIVKVAVE